MFTFFSILIHKVKVRNTVHRDIAPDVLGTEDDMEEEATDHAAKLIRRLASYRGILFSIIVWHLCKQSGMKLSTLSRAVVLMSYVLF